MSERRKQVDKNIEAFRRLLRDLKENNLPNDTEVAEIGPDGQLRILPDLGDKIETARQVKNRLRKIAGTSKSKDDRQG